MPSTSYSPRETELTSPKRLEPKLVSQIVRWLEEWSAGQYGPKLTWEKLSVYSGFSRQALSSNSKIARAFRTAKIAIRRGILRTVDTQAVDDSYSEVIDKLKEENSELKRQAENWSALWEGWDTRLLDRELPKPVHRRRPRH
jgi:hypothetical protein